MRVYGNATPRPLYPLQRPGTPCLGGWVGPKVSLNGCGKFLPHGHSNPGPSSRVYIPTTLSRPATFLNSTVNSSIKAPIFRWKIRPYFRDGIEALKEKCDS